MINHHRTRHYFFLSPHFDDAVLSSGGLIGCLRHPADSFSVITVFGGVPDPSVSAFARHLLQDWQMADDLGRRSAEDRQALAALNVTDFTHWPYAEAAFRRDSADHALYASYEELRETPRADDRELLETLITQTHALLSTTDKQPVLMCPLSLGGHVDHRLIHAIGLQLRAEGHTVYFYEEWPYVAALEMTRSTVGWRSRTISLTATALNDKISAAQQYSSQINLMGGSAQQARERLTAYAHKVGGARPAERYWAIGKQAAQRLLELAASDTSADQLPFQKRVVPLTARDFRKFLDTFHFTQLEEVLPVGGGLCLDVGCGSGRLSRVTHARGYKWLGMEYAILISDKTVAPPSVQADGQNLPFRDGCAAAVISFGVLEYVQQPERAFAEAARVLAAGGVFAGYMPFLEPMQGNSRYGMSPLLIEELLRQYGFRDIRVEPGLNSFVIILWTWLRRWGTPSLGRFAIPLAAIVFVPMAAARYYSSWLSQRLGRGGGYGMRWVIGDGLREFAGYVKFVARMPAQRSEKIVSERPVEQPAFLS